MLLKQQALYILTTVVLSETIADAETIVSANPFLSAVVRRVETEKVNPENAKYEEALVRNLVGIFEEYAYFVSKLPSDIVIGVSVRKEAGEITD